MIQKEFRTGKMFLLLAAVAVGGAAFAARNDEERERFHAAFDACAAELGLQKPEPGKKPPKLSDEQREKLHACLEHEGAPPPPHHGGPFGVHHKRMRACLEASGVKLPQHEPGAERPEPTAEQKAAFEKCRAQVEAQDEAED